MANCESYNCDDDLGLHLLNDCGLPRQGGADALLLIKCGSVLVDPSDGAEIMPFTYEAKLDTTRTNGDQLAQWTYETGAE